MRKRLLILMLVLLNAINIAYAQERTVTGTVSQKSDGATLPGVTVSVKGTKIVVTTNQAGKYSIKSPSNNSILVFSFIGMDKVEATVGTNPVLDIQLASSSQTLDEVIVVGYGTAKTAGTIVSSVATVSAKKLQEKPSANVLDALQGKVAGLQVYTSSGEPSQLSSIRLHGSGSLGASSTPLYVLDGVAISAGTVIDLNSNDFESISVLKDASATSIYGSRAANGVIFITSKKGTTNTDAKIVLSSQYGVSSLANTDYFNKMMNTKQLTDFWIATGFRTQAQVTSLLTTYPNDTKWYKYYYKDNVPTSQGDLSISGGGGKTTYYISGSYFNQEGLAVRSNFDRYTLRSNITSKANDWLTVGLNLTSGYDLRSTNPYTSNSLNGGLSVLAQPFYSPYDANGVAYPDMIPGLNLYNPEYLAAKAQNYASNNVQVNGMTFIQLTPFKGLTLKSQVGVDAYDNRITVRRMPSYLGSLNNGYTYEYFNRNVTTTITNTAEYKFDLNTMHKFTFLAGQEGISSDYTDYTAATSGQTDDRLTLLGAGPTFVLPSTLVSPFLPFNTHSQYAYLSYFSRVEYSYNEKYFGDFSLRNDQSSRFGKANRSAMFYSGGFMWNAKKESFLQDNNIISGLNLKASLGTSGNSSIGNYANLATVGSNIYSSGSGWAINSSGNPDLGWEQQTLLTLGAKISVLKDRFRLNVEYYNRKTANMLISVPYPYTSGFSSVLSNVGTLSNSGLDVTFDFDLVRGNDFYITPYANFNYNKEKVTSLFQGKNYWIIPNTGVCWVVNNPVMYFYPIFAGIDPADGKQMWYTQGTDKTVNTETSTTKVFSSAALEQNTGIKRYAPFTGGFGLNGGWKGITIQADFSFALGKYLINNDRYFTENPYNFSGYNQSTAVLDYWKAPGDNTTMPKYGEITQFDTRLIENASFMRLKNLSIGYAIPSSILKKTGVFKNAKVFVTGRNLLTITKYSGPDPEVDSNLALGTNPNTKQYTVGVELTF
jgi:TonB-linked SusC/RagA family outer membrane protein